MREKCQAEYRAMLQRLDQVIRDKWPETLKDDGGVWCWLNESRIETRQKLNNLRDRLQAAWLNGMFEESKQLTLEWGKLTLEIFRDYAQHLKKAEAL